MAGLNRPVGGGLKLAKFLGILLAQGHGEREGEDGLARASISRSCVRRVLFALPSWRSSSTINGRNRTIAARIAFSHRAGSIFFLFCCRLREGKASI